MSSSEHTTTSPNVPTSAPQQSPLQQPQQQSQQSVSSATHIVGTGKFNVTRTSRLAKADVPLLPTSTSAATKTDSNSSSADNSPTTVLSDPVNSLAATANPAAVAATAPTAVLVGPMVSPPLGPARSPIISLSRGPTPPTQGTPPLAPRKTPVPLITPRYQKKSRTNRSMALTDSFSERNANAGQLLRRHATESLTVTNGPQQYQQEVHFHTYDVYRHGKRQIHSRSVGYSSDGDLVMTREDYSEPSDVDNGVMRVHTVISEPTVLDPSARRPLTDSELNSKKKLHLRRQRYIKYPGIHAPRNKKLRNRLMNDYFVNEQAMRILNLARERREEGYEDDAPAVKPSFQDLPASVLKAFDLADEAQEKELERLGAMRSPNMNYIQPPRDPDSAEARFQALNLRLRGELQHALNSEFLSSQIEDLEVCFSQFIDHGPTKESLVFCFRDGYGRLVCHGVAAYYQLVSESRVAGLNGATKLTFVSFPKPKKKGLRVIRLPYTPLTHVLRGNRSNVPARHPLSAANTPLQGPQPSPSRVPTNTSPGKTAQVPNCVIGGVDEEEDMCHLEPMSPLDLNGDNEFTTQPPLPPPSSATDGGGGKASNELVSSATNGDNIDGGGQCQQHERKALVNPTVVMTIQGKLISSDVPIYVPRLDLKSLEAVVVSHYAGLCDANSDADAVSQSTRSRSSSSSDDNDDEEAE